MNFTNVPLQPRLQQFPRPVPLPLTWFERLSLMLLAVHVARIYPPLPDDLGVSTWWTA